VSERFITVYTNIQMPQVEMVKAVLEDNGILCNIKGYDETRPHLSYGMGIHLQVPERDKREAEKIIKVIFGA